MDFYYVDENRKRKGPISIEDLKMEPIKPDTLVWHRGLGKEWAKASNLPELAFLFTPPSEPAVEPPAPKVETPEPDTSDENLVPMQQSDMITCQNCGMQISVHSNFCKYCGAAKLSEEDTRKCDNCGNDISRFSKFCPYCGSNQS